MRGKIKKIIVINLVAMMILQALAGVVLHVCASNLDMIGTNRALGSPLLDPNFSAEEWNKWEMIVWGIFLSNFTTPLIDSYNSAFNSSSVNGSRGSGYQALRFGSGSDPSNEDTIKDLLGHAIQQQSTCKLKPLFVSFNEVDRSGFKKQVEGEIDEDYSEGIERDPIEDLWVRKATFKDMFLADDESRGDSWVKLDGMGGLLTAIPVPIEHDYIVETYKESERYVDILTIQDGMLPTFYIEHGSGYEKVFDYTDGWDAQILTAWIARTACGDYKGEFKDVFDDMWNKSNDLGLYLDCFGNIVVEYSGDRRIVIPASVNQHLTQSPKINLISSMVFNGYNSGVSKKELVFRGHQSISNMFGLDILPSKMFGGVPALGSNLNKTPQGMMMLYYDLDTIMYDNYFNGGSLSTGEKEVRKERNELSVFESAHNTHYGKAVRELFDLDANNTIGNQYIFKLEAANVDKIGKSIFKDKDAQRSISTMIRASGQIANMAGVKTDAKILTEIIKDGKRVKIFGDPVIIPVQVDDGVSGSKVNSNAVSRSFINFLYEAYKSNKNTTAGELDKQYIKSLLESDDVSTVLGFRNQFTGIADNTITKVMASFVAEETDLYKLNVHPSDIIGKKLGDKHKPFIGVASAKVGDKDVAEVRFSDAGELDFYPGRLIKAYPLSPLMKAVGDNLGVREGTDFALYTPYIYLTYLDWYGVAFSSFIGEDSNEFNPRIFTGSEDVLKLDIKTISNIKTEEEKRKDVLNFTYMMLHPTEGKKYRDEMMRGWVHGFIYDTYQKIVYGNASSFYSNISSDLATRNAAGFLALDSYSDNFMTSWFMKMYIDIAIVLVGVSFILILVVGWIRRRKLSWFLISITVMINAILITPSIGEVTPLLANKFVQSMFKDKMTYWSMAELVTNAKLEGEYLDGINTSTSGGYLSGLNKQEKAEAVELIKTFNIVYLDRALMVRSDISRKVTQTQRGNYAEVQKLRSVRWLLPIIMRQFTANDNSADYVYVPLGDMYDDLSNMYWLYEPSDAMGVRTVNAHQYDSGTGESIVVEDKMGLGDIREQYPDYKDTELTFHTSSIPYRSELYYRGLDISDMTHRYYYILKGDAKLLGRSQGFDGEYEGSISYNKYIDNSIQFGESAGFKSEAIKLEQEAGDYDRFDRATVKQSYGYLWTTENPYHYFYQVIKKSFDESITLGSLVGKLQGQYSKLSDGTEVRTSFMHAEDTGYIKDILDLEELYTNTVPYLYQMQITAGGSDGRSGVLGDSYIEDYDIYKTNYKSWMFRSNWATKIVESPELSKSEVIKDKDGKRIKVLNPVLPFCYPDDRPMVFSEAQMHDLGLHESDLSIVELKNIKINKDVARRWTLLLNYANIKGITKEAIFRQMSTEAMIGFNSEITPTSIISKSHVMYPNGIDLRAISFDSVMKMLMLNITKDTTYIYGDTMSTVINNSDIFSATLLLVAAFLSSFIIPLVRNVTLGLIFYLGLLALLYSILSGSKQKTKISMGYLVSNLVFLGATTIYYVVFKVLMTVTSHDEVLSIQSVQVNVGNPVWSFIIIIAINILYITMMVKMINFCFRHYRDMGMEAYAVFAGGIMGKIAGGIDKLGEKISGYGSIVGEGAKAVKLNANIRRDDIEEEYDHKREDSESREEGSEYLDTEDIEIDIYDDLSDVEEIDREIERGKNK